MTAKDIWDSVKGIVGKIAPVLGNAIVPGVGGVAGSLISTVLGCENDGQSIESALTNATPEQIERIKQLEINHQEKLIELGMENDKLHIKDIQNAREKEIAIATVTGKRDYNLYILAWIVVTGFFILCGILMKYEMPNNSTQVVFMLFGALSTGFGTVLQYFFGSSKSSSDKTVLMAASKK